VKIVETRANSEYVLEYADSQFHFIDVGQSSEAGTMNDSGIIVGSCYARNASSTDY